MTNKNILQRIRGGFSSRDYFGRPVLRDTPIINLQSSLRTRETILVTVARVTCLVLRECTHQWITLTLSISKIFSIREAKKNGIFIEVEYIHTQDTHQTIVQLIVYEGRDETLIAVVRACDQDVTYSMTKDNPVELVTRSYDRPRNSYSILPRERERETNEKHSTRRRLSLLFQNFTSCTRPPSFIFPLSFVSFSFDGSEGRLCPRMTIDIVFLWITFSNCLYHRLCRGFERQF